jgi:DNA-binding CsgD family transcriptional regulator
MQLMSSSKVLAKDYDRADLRDVSQSIGQETFFRTYETFLEHSIGVDDYLVVALNGAQPGDPAVLMCSTRLARTFSTLYIDVLHKFDPNGFLLKAVGVSDRVRNTPLWGDRHYPDLYKAWVKTSAAIIDCYSYMYHSNDTCYYIQYYRNAQQASFTPADLISIKQSEAPLARAIAAHFEILSLPESPVHISPEFLGRVLKDIPATSALSERENQVCSLILMGNTSESIALRLGISRNSVLTYRRRAYERLNITSQHELFVAVIQHVSQTDMKLV